MMNTDEFDHLREAIYRMIVRIRTAPNTNPARIWIVDIPEFVLKAAVNLYDAHVTPSGIPKVDRIYGVPCRERKASADVQKGIYVEATNGTLYPVT